MKQYPARFIFLTLFLLTSVLALNTAELHAAAGKKAMVVTANSHATQAALQVLEMGGNAVDAAIAAQWVLNVVEPESSGIGGGGFFVYYEASGKQIRSYDGREAAPASAFPEMFLDEKGQPYPFRDRITGGLPVGVPGTLKLLKTVHDKHGSKNFSFAELFKPAIEIAERGFPISERLSVHIDQEKDRLARFKESAQYFLDKSGLPLPPDTILFQPNLAKTFREIQKDGVYAFYEGRIAEDIVRAVQQAPYHPGLMQKEDLFYYKIFERAPVMGTYRGYEIFSMGPPSSGGITLIEILHILEGYELRLHAHRPDGIHLLAEAQKLAFQDRNRYLGDPGYFQIPFDKLLSKEFARQRSEEINFEAAIPTTAASVRPLHLEGTHTSHISVVDEFGNMVSYTTTIESVFGSGMIVPGRGFFLNNELTDFDEVPKDESGQLKANAPEGEKRPRSSMTPTFIFKNDQPFMILGSPGGSTIIGTVLNMIVNVIDFGMTLHDAQATPRIINRNGPLELEPAYFQDSYMRRELERRGHPLLINPAFGNVQAILFDHENGQIIGESDPRGEGSAAGY